MLLLDTHVLIWLATGAHARIAPTARELIDREAGQLYVSSIVMLELGILTRRKRLTLPLDFEAFYTEALRQHGVRETPVTGAIAAAAVRLPPIHNDPFDRLMLATARVHRMTLVSADTTIAKYPDQAIVWK